MNSKHLLAAALALVLTGIPGAKGSETANGVQPNAVSCRSIRTAAQLQAMRNDLAASYCLANDIDLASIPNFVPVGDILRPFTGSFFGNNHVIRNLTIKPPAAGLVGLFGVFTRGTIRDVSLVNVNIKSTAEGADVGGLAGAIIGPPDASFTISRVSVSGKVSCAPEANECGGIAGELNGSTLARSWSSADVTGSFFAGGLVGVANAAITDSFATGNISCSVEHCDAGGLVGLNQGPIMRSFATGGVAGSTHALVGGLVAETQGPIGQSFASGAVNAGDSSSVGGLVGIATGGAIDQSFSIGSVQGGASSSVGGLVGPVVIGFTVTNSYWDTDTSLQAGSVDGTGLTTKQLRAHLPAGFDPAVWAINRALSYPFLNDADLAFNAPLATLVQAGQVFTFLPISQLDVSQYRLKPVHQNNAALAAVYTMIARAAGITGNDAQLKNVKIDRFFWRDSTQTTLFAGPITTHARLGALKPVGATANLNAVVDVLNTNRLAILRGSYTNARGATATHWMLATLYTRNGRSIGTIVANDPWTGTQIEIDPLTKRIVSPSRFPLAGFRVDGFRPVTILNPA